MEALLLKILEGQEKTDAKLDSIEVSINNIQEEIVIIKGDVKALQVDMQVVKGDIKELKLVVDRIEENQERTILTMLKHIKKKVDNNSKSSFKTRIN